MFAGTLASAPAPYMNNSNMRYPAATITVENIPHTAHLTEQNNEAGNGPAVQNDSDNSFYDECCRNI